jgi:hypothetical protein
VEILLVVSLLSLIVLALMAVFSSTQRAFRASVTQTDVLEGGRATVDMIARDLRGMVPSGGVSNTAVLPSINVPVNFCVLASSGYPLVQSLPGSFVGRTNLLNWFFVLGRENTKWTGVGYIVDTAASSDSSIYPLYRFYAETNVLNPPETLFYAFVNQINRPTPWTNSSSFSYLLDGVVHLTVRAFDQEGRWIQRNTLPLYTNALNTAFLNNAYGEAQFYMFSNTVPASVELELGILEDQAIARAKSLGVSGQPPYNAPRQWAFLTNQSGSVHLFRQRVSIPNFDSSAYQP